MNKLSSITGYIPPLERMGIELYRKISSSPSNTIAEEDWEELAAPVTEQELWKVVKTSPADKSPGMDGFTNEFYKKFWPDLKGLML